MGRAEEGGRRAALNLSKALTPPLRYDPNRTRENHPVVHCRPENNPFARRKPRTTVQWQLWGQTSDEWGGMPASGPMAVRSKNGTGS